MYYIYRRGHSWTCACTGFAATKGFKWTLAMIFLFMALSPAIAFFLPTGNLRYFMNVLANFHLAIVIYLGGIIVLADFVRFILKKAGVVGEETLKSRAIFASVGGMILIIVVIVCVYGGIHSKDIVLNKQTAVIHKTLPENDNVSAKSPSEKQKMTIAVVADLHLSYSTGLRQVKTVVKYINDMDADLVCMPGDFFTNVYDDVREPEKIIAELKKIKSKYGVYGCWGNHDVDEPILAGFTFTSFRKTAPVHDPRMVSFLKRANIKMLEDEYVLVDDRFYVAGRLDAEKPGIDKERQPLSSVLKGIDKTKPIILVDHEPRELEGTAKAGVDLDISGHTHDGQFFPLNLTEYLIWPNPCGIKIYDKMTSFVTSGAGVYGPNMRVGTDSEVVRLDVTFK